MIIYNCHTFSLRAAVSAMLSVIKMAKTQQKFSEKPNNGQTGENKQNSFLYIDVDKELASPSVRDITLLEAKPGKTSNQENTLL